MGGEPRILMTEPKESSERQNSTVPAPVCPICGEGTLILHVEEATVAYRGETRAIPSQYRVCTVCGSEQASMSDLQVNKEAMRAFRKVVDEMLERRNAEP